jgi:hypothetical protein
VNALGSPGACCAQTEKNGPQRQSKPSLDRGRAAQTTAVSEAGEYFKPQAFEGCPAADEETA